MSYSDNRYLWLGLLNAALLASLLAVLVLRTRSLMAAVGFHAMWNLSETVLLLDANGHVETTWNLHVREGVWTGTASTPETGIIVTLIVFAMGVLMRFFDRRPRRRQEPFGRPTSG